MLDIIAANSDTRFRDLFNKNSFVFEHDLHLQKLYSIDSLIGLARRLGPDSAYWSTRPINVSDGWEDTQGRKLSLEEAVASVETSNTLVVLKNIEQDEIFGPVFQAVVETMAARVGPTLERDMLHGRATLLISSPRRVTGYHIDAEANFLLQLRGEKKVYVFDGSDREVMPMMELERFYSGDLNAAQYKEELQRTKARTIDFRPGLGVHVPIEWPHWVKNGDSVSVSISINYDMRSNARMARLYRANHRLREAGITPTPPGRSSLRDGGKVMILAGLDRLKRHRG